MQLNWLRIHAKVWKYTESELAYDCKIVAGIWIFVRKESGRERKSR